MKRKINIDYLAVIAVIVIMIGCDKIEPPYREASNQSGFVANDSTIIIGSDTIVFDYDTTANTKKVLVEDYTGHLCGNCPYAGLFLNDTLRPMYADRLVVLSVHSGYFAFPCPHAQSACQASAPAGSFTTDFTNPTSDEWDDKFKNSVGGNPNGLIDRIDYPINDHIKYPADWATFVQSQSLKPCDFKIRIINHYDAGSREVRSAVQVKSLINTSDTFKLQVVLIEDSITDWQVWYAPHVPEFDSTYIHRHVMRGAINSDFGQILSDSVLTVGSIQLNGFSFLINANYVATKCQVVAFIYNASTYEVLQVEEESIEN